MGFKLSFLVGSQNLPLKYVRRKFCPSEGRPRFFNINAVLSDVADKLNAEQSVLEQISGNDKMVINSQEHLLTVRLIQ